MSAASASFVGAGAGGGGGGAAASSDTVTADALAFDDFAGRPPQESGAAGGGGDAGVRVHISPRSPFDAMVCVHSLAVSVAGGGSLTLSPLGLC